MLRHYLGGVNVRRVTVGGENWLYAAFLSPERKRLTTSFTNSTRLWVRVLQAPQEQAPGLAGG